MKISRIIKVFLFLVLGLVFQAQSPAESTVEKKILVYKFEIKDEIGPPTWRLTKLAIDEAHRLKADYILLILNTYGGLVDAADSIRTKILNSNIPVIVFIENNAASAGALISLACDSIYMKPGSTIGAATVVNQTGEAVPDKYQSYMRKKMRATAEQNNRNPEIAEAMVDPDKIVEGISAEGKVLTFTSKEALENEFCEGIVDSYQEALTLAGLVDYTLINYKKTTLDSLINWLINPAISGILIALIIGGIYFELQSPGLGFPIAASITGAVLYFAPLYLEGLAENWEIVLFALGIIMVIIELFAFPGFGIVGLLGVFLIVSGLSLSLIGNVGFDFNGIDPSNLVNSIFIVVLSGSVAVGGSILLGAKLLSSHAFSRLVLNTTQKSEEGYTSSGNQNEKNLIGKQAITATIMKPGGKILVNNKLMEATVIEGFIEKNEPVIIESYETGHYFVRKDNVKI